MGELCTHAGFFDYRQYLCVFPSFLFIGFYIALERSAAGVPCHIEQTEAHLSQAGIGCIEVRSIHESLYQFVRKHFSGFIMTGKGIEKFFLDGKVFHDL